MSSHDDIVARARERAEATPIPEDWGYRVALEPEQSFLGRWRGEAEDPDNVDNNGKPRRIFLLWDADDQIAFSRSYVALAREIDRVNPAVGDRVAIYRGEDYVGSQGPGYSFGVEAEACGDPLPVDPAGDSGIPF